MVYYGTMENGVGRWGDEGRRRDAPLCISFNKSPADSGGFTE